MTTIWLLSCCYWYNIIWCMHVTTTMTVIILLLIWYNLVYTCDHNLTIILLLLIWLSSVNSLHSWTPADAHSRTHGNATSDRLRLRRDARLRLRLQHVDKCGLGQSAHPKNFAVFEAGSQCGGGLCSDGRGNACFGTVELRDKISNICIPQEWPSIFLFLFLFYTGVFILIIVERT